MSSLCAPIICQINAIRRYVVSAQNEFSSGDVANIETALQLTLLEIAHEQRKPRDLDGGEDWHRDSEDDACGADDLQKGAGDDQHRDAQVEMDQ